MKVDYHIHSVKSDGDLNIYDLIKGAKDNDCKSISITDHDIIDDYSLISNSEKIEIINGIEFSTDVKGLHILGYGIKNINNVKKYMDSLNQENEIITKKVIKLLSDNNFYISENLIVKYLNDNKIPYKFLTKKHIVKYLIYKHYAKDVFDAYQRIIGKNAQYYIPIKKLTTISFSF